MPLPSNLSYGTVKARFLLAYVDSADVDTDPDGIAPTGTVTFTPSATYIKNATASPAPTVVVPSPITCSINSDGYLFSINGNLVKLLATDDPDTSPVDWTWEVSFNLLDSQGNNVGNLPSFHFALPGGTTVDLADVAPMPASNGVFYLKGDAPDLTVGTVTTGAAGSSAAVTITGTPDAPVLNFTIPKGDTGATGSLAGLSATAPITYTNNTIALADVSPSPAGTYGSSTQIPAITVDAKGRVTSVTTNAASGGGTWSTYTPTLTGITLGTGTTMSAKYTQIGKTVHFRVHFAVSANANALTISTGGTVGLPIASVHNSSVTGFSLADILYVGRDATLATTIVRSPAKSFIDANSVVIRRQVRVTNDGIIDADFFDGYPVNYLSAYSSTPNRSLTVSGTYEAA